MATSKQDGVLSPVLFSIYLNQLIAQLRHLGMGCYMNGLFTGVFIYADDITLLAQSRASMVLFMSFYLHTMLHDVRLYSVLDTVVISGDEVCCSVVFGTLVVICAPKYWSRV